MFVVVADESRRVMLPVCRPLRVLGRRNRWLLEELRISLFAQELKTSVPVSAKRLSEQWGLVRA